MISHSLTSIHIYFLTTYLHWFQSLKEKKHGCNFSALMHPQHNTLLFWIQDNFNICYKYTLYLTNWCPNKLKVLMHHDSGILNCHRFGFNPFSGGRNWGLSRIGGLRCSIANRRVQSLAMASKVGLFSWYKWPTSGSMQTWQ